jgi:hypothetical protein
VNVRDFTLSLTPPSRTVSRNTPATFTVNITRLGGFTGAVHLDVLPVQVRPFATFMPNDTTEAASILTFRTPQVGSGTFTVTGTSAGLPDQNEMGTLTVT